MRWKRLRLTRLASMSRMNGRVREARPVRLEYPPPDLTARIVEHGPTLKIDLSGELDIATKPVARQVINEAFERRPRQVVLNLSRLTFMDSSGVHLAIEARGLAAANDTDLVLIPGPPAVQPHVHHRTHCERERSDPMSTAEPVRLTVFSTSANGCSRSRLRARR